MTEEIKKYLNDQIRRVALIMVDEAFDGKPVKDSYWHGMLTAYKNALTEVVKLKAESEKAGGKRKIVLPSGQLVDVPEPGEELTDQEYRRVMNALYPRKKKRK